MILCSIVYFVLRKSQLTVVGNIFRNLDDALGSSSWHMKATQTNMEEGEGDTERGNSEQEDSDQPRQNEELVPKNRGFGHMEVVRLGMKSLTQTRKPYFAKYAEAQTVNLNRLKHQ